MVDTTISWIGEARRKATLLQPVTVRDDFMKQVRKWIQDTDALVADNPRINPNEATITKVKLQNIDRDVTIRWTIKKGKYEKVEVIDYHP
jgi:hypothetical protein